MDKKPAYTVQQWNGHANAWATVEGGYFIFDADKPVMSTLTKGFASFAYWMKTAQAAGRNEELRLIMEIGEGQPQIICANTPRGFEVGE